jgi:hypothetical protein
MSDRVASMSDQSHIGKPAFVRLELTDEQRARVHAATGVEADAIELGAQELEERIASLPMESLS